MDMHRAGTKVEIVGSNGIEGGTVVGHAVWEYELDGTVASGYVIRLDYGRYLEPSRANTLARPYVSLMVVHPDSVRLPGEGA